jgi:hypothetical protein
VSAVRDAETNFLEFQMRNDNIPVFFDGAISQGWIPWGMLHDMTDTSGALRHVDFRSGQRLFNKRSVQWFYSNKRNGSRP